MLSRLVLICNIHLTLHGTRLVVLYLAFLPFLLLMSDSIPEGGLVRDLVGGMIETSSEGSLEV